MIRTPVWQWLGRLLPRRAPTLSEASTRDAAAIAALHGASFHRGWSEDEVETLLLDRTVVAHRATAGSRLAGFILSRCAGGEVEILSIAVAPGRRGSGLGRNLLDLHLRRLAGLGVGAIFLEVSESNTPARRLYAKTGFREVGRRPNYYREAGGTAHALVLRRDLP
ncbi:MAG: ribosomal protein S18-alanine N-acetyltransferase [Pseudolabrys sp.]